MPHKPRILVFSDWFRPGFKAGGPIRSIQNLVETLGDVFDFSIVTGDRDLLDDAPYPGIERDRWLERSGYRIIYLAPTTRDATIRRLLATETPDWVYLNTFFSSNFTIKPLLWIKAMRLSHPVLLAPRGALGEGALALKAAKKSVYIQTFKALGMHKRVVFHSTDPSETRSIRHALGPVRIREASNVPVAVSPAPPTALQQTLRLVFASRMDPKKNLDLVIRQLRPMPWPFICDIYGAADKEAYLAHCQELAAGDDRFVFNGAVPPSTLSQVLHSADFFVLPTLNENFGHSIIEALAVGTPAIISDQTPWNDLQEYGAGYVVPLNDGPGWTRTFQQLEKLDPSGYLHMAQRAKDYVAEKLDQQQQLREYQGLFAPA